MSGMSESLDELLGISANTLPIIDTVAVPVDPSLEDTASLPAVTEPATVPSVEVISDIEEDYRTARETLNSLVEKGKIAVDNIMDVAKETEHPRAYEVVATLIKTVADTTDKMMDLHKKVNEVKHNTQSGSRAPERDASAVTVQGNAVFVGTTEELRKRLINGS
jgi:hypothetical protein